MAKRKTTASQKRRQRTRPARTAQPGRVARGQSWSLQSYSIGALPIVNHFLGRMRLEELLAEHLPPDDPRSQVPASRVLLTLVRNVLISREPIYGVGEWAQGFAPDVLNLWPGEVALLHDDRLGICLDRLFQVAGPGLILAVVRQVVREFDVRLDELHNDSTSISFYGTYDDAEEEGKQGGRATHAITWGHSKDHRPDLKQLLYILTVSDDGGVPVYFQSASGNVVDDQTHRETWDLLCELTGRQDFLYVADCKLATKDNMNYIAGRGGRFVSILPGTRKEDTEFRQQLREGQASWRLVRKVTEKRGDEVVVVDRLSIWRDEHVSAEGYRLLWFHSTRKVDRDRAARARKTRRTIRELRQLRDRLQSPKTRFRQRQQVEQAVQKILDERCPGDWLTVEIQEQQQVKYRQKGRGRPTADTPYVKQVSLRYTLTWHIDALQLAEEEATDGVFPLISNVGEMSAEELLGAYKRQPVIEKRFSQLKTDFAVAPVYLKKVTRIQALLAIYFFVLLVQALLERELRRAMERARIKAVPIYPEGRPCARPTTRRVLDLFELIERHVVTFTDAEPELLVTQLTDAQRQVLELLRIPTADYGR
jgi:transposase